MAAHIDPLLETQLARASGVGASGGQQSSVAATITLRPPEKAVRSPADVKTLVVKVLERIERATRAKPKDYHVFANVGAFVVDASPAFVKELLRQPEVDTAMANEQDQSAMIPPTNVVEVPADFVEGRAKRPLAGRTRKRPR